MPETVDTSSEAVERLARFVYIGAQHAGHSHIEARVFRDQIRALLAERATMHVDINRLYAERQALEDRCVALQRERDEAITALGIANRAQGLAEGKLEASETAGVVDGWKRRAEAAEAQRDALLAVVRIADAFAFPDDSNDYMTDELFDELCKALGSVREMVDHSD